ncbi:hypothetical protein XENOCAPTIV_031029, partial [Xenoophorus captivus]
TSPQVFGIPLSHVITNDRIHKLRHDHLREEHSNPSELMLSFLHLSSRPNKELSSSNSSLSSTPESHYESTLPSTPDTASRTSRRTVGIFRIGSSKKRVRQLREEFDQGWEVHFNDEHCVHDVAALLKKFLRDLPDPLLTRELYTAFIHTMREEDTDTYGPN